MPKTELPQVLGGAPVFHPPLPMAKPRLPDSAPLLPQFEQILRSGALTKGPHLEEFEGAARGYLEVPECVAVSSCTSGLMLVLQALKRRLGENGQHRIAVPSFTFLASVTALRWAGFEPVFVETDPHTMLIDLDDLAGLLNSQRVQAVMAVHCFGNPVPARMIESVCAQHDVPLIYDAAHGFGSLHEGRKVGRSGWCQVFSLTPTKMVVAGEGGIVATSDGELAEELRVGREYGNDGSYDTLFPGLNARMSEFHAALGTASLGILESVVEHRNSMAEALRQALGDIEGLGFQQITPDSRTTYKDFTVTIDAAIFGASRDAVAHALMAEGVPSRKYFSPACHQHRAFRQFHGRQLPRTEQLAASCLSLPLLDHDTVGPIGEAFRKIKAHAQEIEKTCR